MRRLRRASVVAGLPVAAGLTVALLIPTPTTATVGTLQAGSRAQLGPEGTVLLVPTTDQCSRGEQLISISVSVTQSRGNKTATGSTRASDNPRPACDGSVQTVVANVYLTSSVPFHKGKAVALG